ncbi:hypothetical protein GCM10011578_064110 [Streptomyces fuscichromogenes]|uniref:Uncharacterized protein n=1 Tax=Streptomyces fuscichromogenes TaxID=1324013 RepID=A0A917XI24_9ACTN|nr:hypothetical protein GCM10011578_064110 [Streptomyces fuscichromogenes]
MVPGLALVNSFTIEARKFAWSLLVLSRFCQYTTLIDLLELPEEPELQPLAARAVAAVTAAAVMSFERTWSLRKRET